MDQFTPKEVRILETVEDIQERREQVLNRYNEFKVETRQKRERLEDSRRFQYFKRGLFCPIKRFRFAHPRFYA